MPVTVICPLSGTPSAERALPSAFDAAESLNSSVELFSAVEDVHMVERRRTYLQGLSGRRGETGGQAPTHQVVVNPHAPRAIAERSTSSDVVTVMATSTRPLSHTGYVGSAAERTTREAYHPTVLIGPHCRTRLSNVNRVVIPCDGSRLSERALDHGRAWADRLGVGLWLVTSLSPHESKQVGDDAGAESNYVRRLAKMVDAEWDVLHGPEPAQNIAQWAGDALIALTTHGRSGLSRLTIGSVTTAVVRWATGPVLVVNSHSAVEL